MSTQVRNAWLLLSSIVLTVLLDFGTKLFAKTFLFGQDAKLFLNGFLTLLYMENPGAMLSVGATLNENIRSIIFIESITVCLLIWTIYPITKGRNKSSILYSSLIIGGGYGNQLSRIINNGNVVDFIHLDFEIVATGIFNFADISILIGVALLVTQQSNPNNTNT